MRNSYPAFQRRTKDHFEELWSNCFFAFDASALLDLYRVTPASRKEFLGVLEQLGDPYPEMHEVYEKAERRIQLSVPPGFKDSPATTNRLSQNLGPTWVQMLTN